MEMEKIDIKPQFSILIATSETEVQAKDENSINARMIMILIYCGNLYSRKIGANIRLLF